MPLNRLDAQTLLARQGQIFTSLLIQKFKPNEVQIVFPHIRTKKMIVGARKSSYLIKIKDNVLPNMIVSINQRYFVVKKNMRTLLLVNMAMEPVRL